MPFPKKKLKFYFFKWFNFWWVIWISGESIIVESYDPGDPTQWTTEEVNEIVIDNNEEETAPPSAVIKLENDSVQTHVYECYKCAKRFNYKDKLFKLVYSYGP